MSDAPNIVLAGPMGSGKTAVARLLANWTNRQFIDTDTLIATATGKEVADIFADDGEAAFRALESDAVEAVCERTGLIVAVGGGTVVDPANTARLRETCRVIVLDATPEALARRVEGGRRTGTRPLLAGTDDVAGRLATLKEERADAYAGAAHATFDTTDQPLEVVAAAVLGWVEEQEAADRGGVTS